MILCYSGGLDSLIAWHWSGKPQSIYFDCSSYSSVEMASIKETNPHCIISNVLDLSQLQQGTNAYVLHRNLLFAAVASNFDQQVIIAGVKDDCVEDKNREAFAAMSTVLTQTSKRKVEVTSPFWDLTKSQIVKWFLDNVPNAVDLIQASVSCYNNEQYCGACPSCFRKACALFDNGLFLPYYQISLMMDYRHKAYNGEYDPDRCKSILNYVRGREEWRRKGRYLN